MSWNTYCLDFRKKVLECADEGGLSIKQFKAMSGWKMEFLIDQIKSRDYSTVLEIGTRIGVSALTFAYAIKTLGRCPSIYSVDIRDYGQKEFSGRFPLVSATVDFSIYEDGDTYKFVKEHPGLNVDMLLIDGDHRPKAMRRDYDIFSKLVRPGGMVAFDDVAIIANGSGEKAYSYMKPLGVHFYPIECDNFAWKVLGDSNGIC